MVMTDGFEFESERYKSLTAVAHRSRTCHHRIALQRVPFLQARAIQMNRNKPEVDRSRIRCAVYTRKSTEERLDLEFNSLDTQRDATESFIASQKSEGWICSLSLNL